MLNLIGWFLMISSGLVMIGKVLGYIITRNPIWLH